MQSDLPEKKERKNHFKWNLDNNRTRISKVYNFHHQKQVDRMMKAQTRYRHKPLTRCIIPWVCNYCCPVSRISSGLVAIFRNRSFRGAHLLLCRARWLYLFQLVSKITALPNCAKPSRESPSSGLDAPAGGPIYSWEVLLPEKACHKFFSMWQLKAAITCIEWKLGNICVCESERERAKRTYSCESSCCCCCCSWEGPEFGIGLSGSVGCNQDQGEGHWARWLMEGHLGLNYFTKNRYCNSNATSTMSGSSTNYELSNLFTIDNSSEKQLVK